MSKPVKMQKVYTVTIKMLQEVCRFYDMTKPKTKRELHTLLAKNGVEWNVDETYGNVHHKKGDGDWCITQYDGDLHYRTVVLSVTETEPCILLITPSQTSAPVDAAIGSVNTLVDVVMEGQEDTIQAEAPLEPSVSQEDINSFDLGAKDMVTNHEDNVPQPSPHSIMRIIDMNMDGAMDFYEDDEDDEDVTDWQSYRDGRNCTICGYESKYSTHLKRHIMTKHMPSACQYEKCPTCNKDFNVTSGSFSIHMRRGHIDLTGKQIIKVNDDPDKGFMLVRDPTLEKVYQVVFIPWVNRDGDRVQVSIGVTQRADVKAYATGIWSCVMASFKKRHMSIVACGSAINASEYHRIVMYPAGAFAPDIYGCTLTVANKVKGYLRELVDSIRHIAANDVFGYLDPVEAHIIRCLKGVIHTGQLPMHNLKYFFSIANNEPVPMSTMNRRTFDISLISKILEDCDIVDEDD